MKNVKFGMFCLGLAGMVGAAVSSLDAQGIRVQAEPGRRVQVQRPDVMMLDTRGAQLGVMVSDLDVKAATPGVKIDDVTPESPADKAGIKPGDVVVEFDGERVRSARQFTRLVQETPEGRSVSIALMRDGKRQTVNATPETSRMTWNFGPEVDRAMREAERGMREFRFEGREPRRFEYRLPERVMPYMTQPRGRLGVTVQSLTDDLESYFGVKNGGALVSSVTPDSAASKAGVKAGDVIVSFNGRSVADSDDLLRELEDFTGEATLVVVRDKKEMTLKATIQANGPTGERVIRRSRPGII
ncbi:MAG TPA: PDZ domain-containing protein [Vicinamibacterales bacterium]|nr:PDZ domain-containing protein [Vicinamibacterales bacterium]